LHAWLHSIKYVDNKEKQLNLKIEYIKTDKISTVKILSNGQDKIEKTV